MNPEGFRQKEHSTSVNGKEENRDNLIPVLSLGLLFLYLFMGLLGLFLQGLQFFVSPELFFPAIGTMGIVAVISRSRYSMYGGLALLTVLVGYIIYVSFLLPDLVDPMLYFMAVCFPMVLIPVLALPAYTALGLMGILILYMGVYTWWSDLSNPILAVFPVVFCIIIGVAIWQLTRSSIKNRFREDALTESLGRLYHFATVSSRTADFETALQTALAILGETFPDSRAAIMLVDDSGENLVIRAATGYPEEAKADGYSISIDTGLTGWSYKQGERARVGDVHADPRYFSLDQAVQSEMCVPLRDGSRSVGVINLESTSKMAYSQEEEHFLETMAPLLTSFIINARLQREAQALAELNRTLLETAPAGFITYRDTGECVYLNQTMLDILGKNEDEVLMENLFESSSWEKIGLLPSAKEAINTLRFQKLDPALNYWTGERVLEYYLQPFQMQGETHLLIITVDNTEHARMQRALEDERNFVATILEHAAALVMVFDQRGVVWRFNAACEQLSGITSPEAIGRKVPEIMKSHEENGIGSAAFISRFESKTTLELTAPWVLGDGSIRQITWTNTAVVDGNGDLDYVVAVGKDITEEQELTNQLRLQAEALNSAANGIVITDMKGTIEWVNPAVTNLTGYSAEELIGQNPRILQSGKHDNALYADLWGTILGREVWHGRMSNKRKDGSIYTEEMTITPVCDEGQIHHFIAIKRDITEQQQMEQALQESEARFRAFITGASVGMFVGDDQGNFIEINPALAVMCGYSVDELFNLGMANVIHPDDESESGQIYDDLLAGHKEQEYINLRIIRKNGQLMWARVGMGMVRNTEGKPVYIIGVVEDVSEKHWAEEALEQSERRLEQITNSVDQCIYSFAISAEGEFVSPLITPSISKFSGYDVEAHLTNPDLWLQVIHPDDQDQVRVKYEPHLATDERVFLNYRVVDRRGQVHWIKDDVIFQRNEAGLPVRMEGVLTDITALKSAQAALEEQIRIVEKTNIRLRELDRLKSNFLANVSHELRTPLNSIIGFAELLVDGLAGDLNDQQNEFINDIHSSGKHLLDLINDILDLSKIEAGRMEIHPEPLDFAELIEETIASISHLFKQKGQILRIEVSENLPEVKADRVRIKQVLLNLLSNAYKFTLEKGSVTLKAGRLDSSALLVSVSDTGIGIAEEDYDSVFAEFQQVDSSATREIQGTGLGVPISRRIIEMHGGRMWMESVLGEGTTFTFILPLTGPAVPGEVLDDTQTLLTSTEDKKSLVLVIEDDRRYANILAFHFNHEGFDVAHVYRGEDALEAAGRFNPCLITLDLMLPDMEGWDLLKLLKTDPKTNKIPVAVLSALDEREAGWGLWREYGAVAHMVKPIQHEDIRSLLESFDLIPKRKKMLILEGEEAAEAIVSRGLKGFPFLEVTSLAPRDFRSVQDTIPDIDMFAWVYSENSSLPEGFAAWLEKLRKKSIPILALVLSEENRQHIESSELPFDGIILIDPQNPGTVPHGLRKEYRKISKAAE
ncbi:MAG: PAS domain S-box protein [Anaerolineales bacterium]|nr:PAS domain S-box protein [Anaerolineales bacterium]